MSNDPFHLPPGRVQVSFSGGRTSAYMLNRLIEANGDAVRDEDRVQVIFSNTGREMPQTLDFVAEVGRRWQVPIAWAEWRPRVTDDVRFFDDEDAAGLRCRDWVASEAVGEDAPRYALTGRQGADSEGLLFEAFVRQKRFLPNQRFRMCTQHLKVRPARDYLRSLGWEHWTAAIGIRADEPHRLEGRADLRERWTRWLPLAEAGVTKADVTRFWAEQDFDLRLENVRGSTPWGNCDGCFLKSEAVLARLAVEQPERHAWWERMEALAQRLTSGSGGRWSKRYSRRELREAMERQGDLLLSTEGALCQRDDGDCVE